MVGLSFIELNTVWRKLQIQIIKKQRVTETICDILYQKYSMVDIFKEQSINPIFKRKGIPLVEMKGGCFVICAAAKVILFKVCHDLPTKELANKQLQNETTAVHVLHDLASQMGSLICSGQRKISFVEGSALVGEINSDRAPFMVPDKQKEEVTTTDDNKIFTH